MSNYIKKAVHPKTGKVLMAWFFDNYFGHRQYGVGFRPDGTDAKNIENGEVLEVFPISEVDLPEEELEALKVEASQPAILKFKVGDKVEKVKSYKFDGTVVGCFTKLDGKNLVNVEHEDGWVHIFREEDLKLR